MHAQFTAAGFDPQVRELSSFYDDYGLKEYPVEDDLDDEDEDDEDDEYGDEDEDGDENDEDANKHNEHAKVAMAQGQS